MFTHIVLFRLKDRSPASVMKARDVLMSMKGKIPMLRHLEVGIDLIHSERSYDIALLTRFDSPPDLKAYQAHPVHVKVAGYIMEAKESNVAVDYESD